MKRGRPLRRGKPLTAKPKPCCGRSLCSCGEPPKLAKAPVKPINRKRRAKLFSEGFESEERVEWYRHQFCVVPGCDEGPCHVAHVKSRGAGGKADDAVPLCTKHHSESHDIGILTFQRKYGIDLPALAVVFARKWKEWQR